MFQFFLVVAKGDIVERVVLFGLLLGWTDWNWIKMTKYVVTAPATCKI